MGDVLQPDRAQPVTSRQLAARRLAAEHAITRILAQASSFSEAAPLILHAIGESLHVDLCQLWTLDEPAGVLRWREAWVGAATGSLDPFIAYSRPMIFRPGEGLPGRVWAAHQPARIENVQTDTNFSRAPVAIEVGLRTGIAFPILANAECIGVIEFFTRQPMAYDPPLLAMLDAVGSEIGQFMQRKQVEAALRHANLRFELAELAARGFGFDWDVRRGSVEYTQGLTTVLGYAEDEGPRTAHDWEQLIHPDDLDLVRADAQAARTRNGLYSVEYRVRHKDGHYIHVWDRGMELRDEQGELIRIIGSTIDITARKQAELNRQFLSELDTLLRPLTDPEIIRTTALSALGMYLNVTRCTFNDVDSDSARVVIARPWHQPDAPSLTGRYQLTDIVTPDMVARSRAGQTLVIHDTRTDSRSAERYATGYGALGIGAIISVPCMSDGRWSALLSVHHAEPRVWRDDEVALVEAVAARVWPAITRARTEQALRESQAMLALAMRGGRMGAWARDMRTNQVWWSRELEELFGLPPGGFEGTESGFYDFVYLDDRVPIATEIEAALVAGRDYSIEFRFHHADGSIRWMEGRGRAVYSPDGQPLRLYGIGIDITERKQAEEQLRESAAQLRALGDNLPNGVLYQTVLDTEGQLRFTYLSQGVERLAGVRAEDALRDSEMMGATFLPEDRPRLREATRRAAETMTPLNVEARRRTPDGEIRWFQYRAQPRRLPDGSTAFDGIELDITDRKRGELERESLLMREQAARAAAEAASRAKDEFLATVSHELRTPLTAILGWASTLRSGRTRVDTQRALQIIEQNARAQAQLIEDILDISRIVAGKFKLDMRPTHLPPVIQAAVESVRPAAEARSIQLSMILDPTLGPVTGDADRLQQVVWNLMSNAVKFTPPGGHVWVQLAARGREACITVKDTGMGIPLDFLPYVFDRFRQADGSSTRQHQGLGLGLAIVRHIVELHGGAVGVESAGEGQGATFTVCLPIPPSPLSLSSHSDSGTHQLDTHPAPSQRGELAGVRILVVDDMPDNLELLQTILEERQAEVRAACTVADAMAILKSWWPDILLSDIAMPGQDGYNLIRQIKQDYGEELPSVALTGYARVEDQLRVLAAGFDQFVPKPVDPDELVQILLKLLEAV